MNSSRNRDVPSAVVRYIREHRLFTPGQTVLVAVSGGADSVCLLHLLAKSQRELGIRLHVAHLNHQLRGKESAADAEYVRKLAARLRLPATIETGDVLAYRKVKRLPLEEAAREVRYRFLARTARAAGVAAIAVGHTRDDQVETVLMHIIHGAGTWGLTGLQPDARLVFGNESARIVRPLLGISRIETTQYCTRYRLAPRSDPSNLLPEFLRNRVRLELLPQLRTYNPRFDSAILRLAQVASEDTQCLQGFASGVWDFIVEAAPREVRLRKSLLARESRAIQRELLRMAVSRLLGSPRDFTFEHFEAMAGLVGLGAGKKLMLPHGLLFSGEHGWLTLGYTEQECPLPLLRRSVRLKIPGETLLPGWRVTAGISTGKVVAASDPFTASFDLDRIGKRLSLSRREPGDRFQPLGLPQPKKLQDFFVDSRVPASWRDRVPLVRSGEGIAWVVGWRIAEWAKVTDGTKTTLTMGFVRTDW
jgi:tRNA(Ile)-lysidine synthase